MSQRQRRAFTLLELLLALTMMVVIATALGASIYTAYRAKTSAEEAVAANRASSLAIDILAQELGHCLPPTANSSQGGFTIIGLGNSGNIIGAFTGTAEAVTFSAAGAEPYATLTHDVREIEYALTTDNETQGQMLVRRVRTNQLAPVIETPPEDVICHDVISFQLRYTDGASWYDAWDSTQKNNALPIAVELTLELAPAPSKRGTNSINQRVVMMIPITCGVSSASTTGGL
jgi:general secretion pathway protein J